MVCYGFCCCLCSPKSLKHLILITLLSYRQLGYSMCSPRKRALPFLHPNLKNDQLQSHSVSCSNHVWCDANWPIILVLHFFIPYCEREYRSLAKKGPWVEHLTSLPKRGVGALSTVSAFNHEIAPTSRLHRLEALEANNWTQINAQRNYQRLQSRVLTVHNTLNGTMWRWA